MATPEVKRRASASTRLTPKSRRPLDLGGAAAPTLAIYKIEEDMLTLCSAMPEFPGGRKGVVAGRPTAFEAPAGSRLVLMTFKRMEKKKE